MAAADRPPVRSQKDKLLRLIECPICLNELQDPRLLSCRHTLCYTCVRDYTEKGNYSNQLPCPVCRGVTDLYQGGVDNLPKFFLMNELKEVVTEQDDEDDSKLQPQGGPVCSAEDCGQPAVKFCKDGCQFLCQQCFGDHQTFKLTRNHEVIPSSEGEAFTKPGSPPFPPCNLHKQIMDLYCRTCNIPICTTCSVVNHRGHNYCLLKEQATVCKTELEQIHKDTDALIQVVKQAVEKTNQQVLQAEADIDEACGNITSTFKMMHKNLTKEEQIMISDLQEAQRRVRKTGDVTVDSQMITLARLASLRSYQVKLSEKDNDYDYVTVTDSIKRDVEDHYGQQLPGCMWSCQMMKKDRAVVLCPSGMVGIKQTEETIRNRMKCKQGTGSIELKEAGRIRLHNQQHSVLGLVVYKEHIYAVHLTSFIVYCFTNDGSLCSKYRHYTENKTDIQGMCLMIAGGTDMLVVSDVTDDALVWIEICGDFTMKHLRTQHLDYAPHGSYNDRGDLMISDEKNHRIHCYTGHGQPLGVITLPGYVRPFCIARCDAGDQYVITDYKNSQVVITDGNGRVKTRYKNKIDGVKIIHPCGVITDTEGRIIISDESDRNQVLLLSKGDRVKTLLHHEHVKQPNQLFLDTDHSRLYVCGEDNIFLYNYSQPCGGNAFIEIATK